MDQIVQLLFNPNHQAPSPLVLAVLVALAVGMPPIMRYLAGKSNNGPTTRIAPIFGAKNNPFTRWARGSAARR